uniref:Uncharacterized protein n=1 Tax=Arundo donax TaxID=35708 RepID=A0A0A9B3D8_ARUDO
MWMAMSLVQLQRGDWWTEDRPRCPAALSG